MSTEDPSPPQQAPATEPEPHLADGSSLSDAAMWLVSAAASGVVYDLAKGTVKALLQRFGRRQLLAEIHKIAEQKPPQPELPPAEIEHRCVALIDRVEDD